MAFSLQPYSWANGFRAPAERFAWQAHADDDDDDVREDDFVVPPHAEELTSTVHNSVGLNYIRTWPTLLNGTKNPHGLPPWWRKQEEVDVLIVGGTYPAPRSPRHHTRLTSPLAQPGLRVCKSGSR